MVTKTSKSKTAFKGGLPSSRSCLDFCKSECPLSLCSFNQETSRGHLRSSRAWPSSRDCPLLFWFVTATSLPETNLAPVDEEVEGEWQFPSLSCHPLAFLILTWHSPKLNDTGLSLDENGNLASLFLPSSGTCRFSWSCGCYPITFLSEH